MEAYIEKNCCIEHEGKKFCAGGAIITEQYLIAYLSGLGMIFKGKRVAR